MSAAGATAAPCAGSVLVSASRVAVLVAAAAFVSDGSKRLGELPPALAESTIAPHSITNVTQHCEVGSGFE